MSSIHKPILAERFKTQPCVNFQKTGSCPYDIKCMFAHGDDDLRTKEMNLADNLTTEDAIKAFQYARKVAARRAARRRVRRARAAQNSGDSQVLTDDESALVTTTSFATITNGSFVCPPSPATIPSTKSPHTQLAGSEMDEKTLIEPLALPPAMADARAKAANRYRHDPYSATPSGRSTCVTPSRDDTQPKTASGVAISPLIAAMSRGASR